MQGCFPLDPPSPWSSSSLLRLLLGGARAPLGKLFHGCSWRNHRWRWLKVFSRLCLSCSHRPWLLPPILAWGCFHTLVFVDFSCSSTALLSSVQPRHPRVLLHSCHSRAMGMGIRQSSCPRGWGLGGNSWMSWKVTNSRAPISYLQNPDGKRLWVAREAPCQKKRIENGIQADSVKISVAVALLGYPN